MNTVRRSLAGLGRCGARLLAGWRDEPWPRLAALAAGILLALALPGPSLWPLALVVPALLRRSLAGTTGWAAFRRGWLAGFAQWVVAVAWVYIVLHRFGHLPAALAVIAVALMAALMGLGWAVAGWGTRLLHERWQPLALPVLLVAFEQIQHLPPWIFPWNPVAAALTAWPPLLVPAPVVGAAGLSLLVYLTGSGLALVVEPGRRRAGAAILAATAVITAVTVAAAPAATPTGPPRTVAAIQPNIALEERWDADNERRIEDTVWRLSDEAARRGASLVVWPESAVPRIVDRDGEYRRSIEQFTARHGAWLLFGSIGIGEDEGEYYNSVYVASPAGILPGRYSKIHLVPFGEYVPLVGALPFLRPLVREVGSFLPGDNPMPLPSPLGPAGVAVCYEVAFPDLAADQVRRGASVLVTITNDGWYGDSAAPRQHLALAVLRAAENRRFMIRAANTGISAIIDPTGRIVQRLDIGQSGMLLGEVAPLYLVTPAARFGDAIRAGFGAAGAGVILAGVWRRRRTITVPTVSGLNARGNDD